MQEVQKVVVENAASINAGQDRTTKTAITMNKEIQTMQSSHLQQSLSTN